MAGFKIDLFKGTRPRISALKLPPGEAQTAQNVDLGSGDLKPWDDKSTTQAVSSGRETVTIYRFDNSGTPLFLEWNDVVDVVRGPVKGDLIERTYYTGDTTGTGAPKMTNTDLVGSSGPYPEAWVYMGIPPPASALTVTVFPLPEDVPQANRLVPHLTIKTNEVEVDNAKFTVYPGTGDHTQIWRWATVSAGALKFDLQKGTALRVTEVINFNKVKLESASEPGIFVRTLNADKTSSEDWKPLESQGSTQTADAEGWRVPAGAEVTIIGHRLAAGDIIIVSGVNASLTWSASLTTDLYEQSWAPPTLIDVAGTSYYSVGNGRLSSSAVSGDTQFTIRGSFYYDVDRAASEASELEERTYVYTYVSDLGEEGPPSPVSDPVSVLDGVSVDISELDLPPTIGFNITLMRIYRTSSSEAGTEYQLVKEISISRNATDAVPSDELGEVITTTTWDPPDPLMIGLTAMPNGMLVGFKGKNIYFCEPYFPHAWPAEYDQAIDHEIIGLSAFGNTVAVMTKGWPYLLTGSHPRNVNLRPIKVNQACVSKESIATDGDKVYYASPDGLVEISVNGIRVATENYIEKKDWTAFVPTTMVGEFHEGQYYGFWDFDVSAVLPVRTAEVSGTITSADENELINGGPVIILTLTNDLWVVPASFDAQRQGIIDGLTCDTNQTLGWNNIVRDTTLTPGDVIRTSDTVVTITLPASPGYSVTANEVIQPTIPAAALQVSVIVIPTGSTFTIADLTPSATVTIGGDLDGDDEAAVVAGGNTVTLSLVNDTWIDAGTEFDAQRQGIIDGIQAITDETNGWNDTAIQEIALTAVVRTSATLVTVTLPAIAAYNITANESLTALVPAAALVITPVAVTSINSIVVLAINSDPSAVFSGSILGATENEVVAGAKQIIITLTNDTWIAAGTGPIGTAAESQALVDTIIATTGQTFGWNAVVVPGIEASGAGVDLVRTSATVATITLDAEATYSIATNETIGATLPAAVLVTSTANLLVSNTFGITAQAPVTCVLTGTVTASITELDIVPGGKTIILTLTEDTWLAAGTGPIGTTANTQAIIDGISAASSPAGGWNLVVRDVDLSPSDVVRTSDTVATITLPASATYDISAQETVEATVPAEAMNISASAVIASPTFTVDFDVPASAVLTGTITASTGSRDIIAGGKTIILTVSDDTWVAAGATFDLIRQDIIDGLSAATSPAGGWNDEVRDLAMTVGDVIRTSNTVVTVTLPAAPSYDINVDEVITATIPADALSESLIAVVATTTPTITAFVAFSGRIMVGYDSEAGLEGKLQVSHFDLDYYTAFIPVIGSAGDDNYPRKLTYSEAEDIWVGYMNDSADGGQEELYTSTDDGDTWTQRSTTGTPVTAAGGLYRSDKHDVFLHSVDAATDYVEWSGDGITWAAITAAVTANVTAHQDFIMNEPDAGAHQFLYGGDFIYMVGRDSGGEHYLVRSVDLTGAGEVTSDWGNSFKPVVDTSGNPQVFGTGHGTIFCMAADPAESGDWKLEWCQHSRASFIKSELDLPKLTNGLPFALVFGNDTWVAVNADGQYMYVDLDGGVVDARNPTLWTKQDTSISNGKTFKGLFYSADAAAATGQFVAWTQDGVGAAAMCRVYTSPNGINWVLRKEFDDTRSLASFVQGKYLLDDTDLDVATAYCVVALGSDKTETAADVTGPPWDVRAGFRLNSGSRQQQTGSNPAGGGAIVTWNNDGTAYAGTCATTLYEIKWVEVSADPAITKISPFAAGAWNDWDGTETWEARATVTGAKTWVIDVTMREKLFINNEETVRVTLNIDAGSA